jgi:peptide subunit release factor RF-3
VAFERREGMLLVKDVELRPILLFASEWMVHRAVEKYPDLKFIATAQPPRRAGRR